MFKIFHIHFCNRAHKHILQWKDPFLERDHFTKKCCTQSDFTRDIVGLLLKGHEELYQFQKQQKQFCGPSMPLINSIPLQIIPYVPFLLSFIFFIFKALLVVKKIVSQLLISHFDSCSVRTHAMIQLRFEISCKISTCFLTIL